MTGGQRLYALGTAIASIALLAWSALGDRWLDGPGEIGFGLREFVACHAAGCDSQSISALPKLGMASGFVEAGWATTVSIGVSIVMLVFALIPIATADRRSSFGRAMARLAQLALFLALVAGTIFMLRRPASGIFGMGRDFLVFGVGVILGFTAAMQIGKVTRPPADQP